MSFLAIFIEHPWVALLPALAFAAVASGRGRAMSWIAAAAWLLYALYEGAVARRMLCSGECNIRVDLVLIYPVLLVLSLIGIVSALRTRQPT